MYHTLINRERTIRFAISGLIATLSFVFPQHALAAWNEPVVKSNQHAQCLAVFPESFASKTYDRLPVSGLRPAQRTIRLSVTAYSSTVDQTDADPFTTAAGTQVRDGIIAYNYLPFGTQVRFPDIYGDRIFVVEDRLNARSGPFLADIWMPSRAEALQWGKRIIRMEIL